MTKIEGPPARWSPLLSYLEQEALHNLIEEGCHLFYQRGKERLPGDDRVHLSHLVGRGLDAPHSCDSIGVDVGTLPTGVRILDVDNAEISPALLKAIEELGAALSVERTPSGGLHIWGFNRGKAVPKEAASLSGIHMEYFSKGRITILGAGRSIITWVPIRSLEGFPSYLQPVKRIKIPCIEDLIPLGKRWDTLYQQVRENQYLSEEVLEFQARYLCKPPLEEDKVRDLRTILLKREQKEEENGGASGEEPLEKVVCEAMAEWLRDRWVYRLPEEEWYKYEEDYWATNEGSFYALMKDIRERLDRKKEEYSSADRKLIGTLRFRRLVEENMREQLCNKPTSLPGLHFRNGLLAPDPQGNGYVLIPPRPGLWSFTRCGIALDLGTPLTPQQKGFLLDLMDGDPMRINTLRCFLKRVFTQDNTEQVSLYLWGPGA